MNNIHFSNSFNAYLNSKNKSKPCFGAEQENKQEKKTPNQIPVSADKKLKVSGIVAAGTLASMILIAKYQKKGLKFDSLKNFAEIFKIKYGVNEMTLISGAAIASGVLAGIYTDKAHNKTHKIKEGVFQFMNATLPTLMVGVIVEKLEKSKRYNTVPAKIAGVCTGLIVGMPISAWIANKINDPNELEPDRKLGFKDMLVNIDDALGALVLAKIPFIDKIHADRFLPAIFAWCGYRAGTHK